MCAILLPCTFQNLTGIGLSDFLAVQMRDLCHLQPDVKKFDIVLTETPRATLCLDNKPKASILIITITQGVGVLSLLSGFPMWLVTFSEPEI